MERESIEGFGFTVIQAGDVVRIRKGFGTNAYGRVDKLCNPPFGDCEVTLTKVGKNRAGWAAGNRVGIFSAWLEGSPMI